MDQPPTTWEFIRQAAPDRWQSDGSLFNGLLNRMARLGPGGFRALLWHQGESDANQPRGHQFSGNAYREMMERLIRACKARAGFEFPWLVAQTTYHTPDEPSSPEIRDAQKSLWDAGIALEGPDTDTLGPEFRDSGGKGVHFNWKGLHKHALMWADKVQPVLEHAPTIQRQGWQP